MSILRVQFAARLLPPLTPTSRLIRPIQRRHESGTHNTDDGDPKTAPGPRPGDSAMIRQADSAHAMTDQSSVSGPVGPDINIHSDHGTSALSPIPRNIMDGSEEGDVLAAAVLSGAPIDLQQRTVRIYRPTKTATQSGDWHGHSWWMDWDVLGRGHRWESPMMGWQSSADFMQGTHLNFRSKEAAINFAEKQGYEYFVQEPNERKFIPKAYANNFVHSPKPLKVIRTK